MRRASLVLGICLIGSGLSACATWQELTPQPNRAFTLDSTKIYGLVLTAGDTLRIRHAVVVGDSAHWADQVSHGSWVHQEGAVRLSDIRRVELYGGSGVGREGVAIGFVAAATVGFILLMAAVGHMDFLQGFGR